MRIAIVVLAVVLAWLLLTKKSQAGSLPLPDPDKGGSTTPLPSQPVPPGPGDTITAYDQAGNRIDFAPGGSLDLTAPEITWSDPLATPVDWTVLNPWTGEQPLAPARP